MSLNYFKKILMSGLNVKEKTTLEEELNSLGSDTSNAFIVTFTENSGEWTADKTFDEAVEASENGRVCLAKVGSTVSGISIENYYPMIAKMLPSETYSAGQIAFGFETYGKLAEYILVKDNSGQRATYLEVVSYDSPQLQQDGKILMSQNHKWTAVTPDFATKDYVDQKIAEAISNALGSEH